MSGLLAMLADVADPRHRRGVRHRLVAVLATAVVATLAGASNYRELASHAADLPQDLLWLLGARWCVRRRGFVAPSGATLRRVLTEVDAADLDRRVGAWLRGHAVVDDEGWVIAMDGKALRGAWNDDGALALFSAMQHHHGVVLGQVRVPETTTEATQVEELLEPMDIDGGLLTADAAHTSDDTAAYVVADKHADYLLQVKGNRPRLQHQVIGAIKHTSGQAPHDIAEERGHGRINRWTTWTTSADGITFPDAAQVACIRRDVLDLARRRLSKDIALLVTSRAADRADAAAISRYARGHWGIENLEHHVRDTCWREDDQQAYTGNGPRTLATLRNLALSLLRLHGHTKIKQTVQWIGRDRMRALPLIAT